MQSTNIKELAARLEQADSLSNRQRADLLKDLERFASRDLYGAAQLCKDHLKQEAQLRLPTVLQAAPLLAKHFEMRMDKERRPIDLHYEQDKQMRQPEAGRQYLGPVVATTPNCVVQRDKETGDLIVHKRSSLVCAFEAGDRDNDLSIRYPQSAIGGVGLVTRHVDAYEAGLGHEHALQTQPMQAIRAMELGQ